MCTLQHVFSGDTVFNSVLAINRREVSALPGSMNDVEFLDIVRQEASLSTAAVEQLTDAVLSTLGERITDGQAAYLAHELPQSIADVLYEAIPGEAAVFGLDEFIRRVADWAAIDPIDVVIGERFVASALSTAAATESEQTREQLPSEFDVLFEPGGPITETAFLETVQQRNTRACRRRQSCHDRDTLDPSVNGCRAVRRRISPCTYLAH